MAGGLSVGGGEAASGTASVACANSRTDLTSRAVETGTVEAVGEGYDAAAVVVAGTVAVVGALSNPY